MKNRKATIFIILFVFGLCSCTSKDDEMTYGIATGQKNGMTMIYRFISKDPKPSEVQRFKWLTVISWKYDGRANNGMPNNSFSSDMDRFEDAIDEMLRDTRCGMDVYVRTGDGEREFVYYIADREEFTKYLNAALANHKVYPIEIEFFEDVEWLDFKKMKSLVNKSS